MTNSGDTKFPCSHVPMRGSENFWKGHAPIFPCSPVPGGGLKILDIPISHVPMFPCSDVPKLNIHPPSHTCLKSGHGGKSEKRERQPYSGPTCTREAVTKDFHRCKFLGLPSVSNLIAHQGIDKGRNPDSAQ